MKSIEWIQKKINVEQLPPVLYIFIFPFIFILELCFGTKTFIKWLLGYWVCNNCNKELSIKDKKNQVYHYEDTDYICDACLTMDKLTDD